MSRIRESRILEPCSSTNAEFRCPYCLDPFRVFCRDHVALLLAFTHCVTLSFTATMFGGGNPRTEISNLQDPRKLNNLRSDSKRKGNFAQLCASRNQALEPERGTQAKKEKRLDDWPPLSATPQHSQCKGSLRYSSRAWLASCVPSKRFSPFALLSSIIAMGWPKGHKVTSCACTRPTVHGCQGHTVLTIHWVRAGLLSKANEP